MAAGQRLGASVMNLRLPYSSSASDGDVGVWTVGNTPLKGNRPAVDVLKGADMVVETLFLLFSAELTEIQMSGARILTCIEPVDVLARLFPTDDLRRRTDVAEELLSSASVLRFTNARRHGCDLPDRLSGQEPVRVRRQAGRLGPLAVGRDGDHRRPRRRCRRPRGGCPGDILLPFKRYVQDAIELTIEAGRITDISGGVEAELVRQYMADFDDPDAYGISHIGWGLDERAKWSALATDQRGHGMELRAFCGNVLFSTGPNELFGGPNHTACHLDIPMRNCSLFLDERPIIVDGEIVVDAMRPGRRDRRRLEVTRPAVRSSRLM